MVFLLMGKPSLQASCEGRFVNPITDVCWKCIFPLKIAGVTVVKGNPDPGHSRKPLCTCPNPPKQPLIGIPISFWEPVRLVDVTRTPYCLVSMGGLKVSPSGIKDRGHVSDDFGDGRKRSFYNVHWYIYPIFSILEVLTDFLCREKGGVDVAYMTELDPFWNDDERSAIINPEGILFGNVVAQLACAADCMAASAHLPIDALFWCGGCQGSVYPFGGTINDHSGGVQASLLLVTRLIAKLHRQGVLWGYAGDEGLCGRYFLPILKKSHYRTQMTYPIPQTSECQTLGKTEIFWQGGREYPYKGEDFGYLIWRKRSCCLGAV